MTKTGHIREWQKECLRCQLEFGSKRSFRLRGKQGTSLTSTKQCNGLLKSDTYTHTPSFTDRDVDTDQQTTQATQQPPQKQPISTASTKPSLQITVTLQTHRNTLLDVYFFKQNRNMAFYIQDNKRTEEKKKTNRK